MAFFRNTGQFLGNYGKAVADIGLSTFGADNVIQDSAYKGYGADQFQTIADVGGNITKMAAPIAAGIAGTAFGIPPSVSMGAVQGLQQVGGSFNPEAEGMQQPVAPVQPYYNGPNVLPQQTYAQSYRYGGYVKGRLRGYQGGGIVGPYAPGYNPQEEGPYSLQYLDQKQISPGITQQFQTDSGIADTYSVPDPYATGYGSRINYNINPDAGGGGSFTPQEGVYQPFATQRTTPPQSPQSPPEEKSGLNPYIAAGTLALGALQTIQGYRGLKRLQKEAMPSYSVNPTLTEAYQRAQQASQRGYTPEQEVAFKTNLAQNQNTAYRNAISQSGGNLAQAINAGLQSQNINALNQFAASDAEKRQQNIQYADSFAPRFQAIQDENTKSALNYRLAREKALGEGVAKGQQNLATGLNYALAAYAGS